MHAGGRTVCGVRLRPLDCWDCGFESRRGHGCSSVESVLCRVGRGRCDELITHSEESCRVCVCLTVCDLETWTLRQPRSVLGCCSTDKQDRQCTYNVILRRVRVTIVAVEKLEYYIFWVCVCSLSYPACKVHAPYFVACSVVPYFSTIRHKWKDFRKKSYWT